ncbi:hypothetical protein [Methanosarcina horonobensis]|uniref:hypothetical protein n=1 Tax=Methanosarcina horonobensis TaxID=418008 RepID=UPI000B1C373F|nr:hypothetical protein [Methanosarcina horonobensis]
MEKRPELKRELSLVEITLTGIGSILGAGIYVLLGTAAGLAGNLVWFSFFCLQGLLPHFPLSVIWNSLLCIRGQGQSMSL